MAASFETLDPRTGAVVATRAESTTAEVAEAARRAAEAWGDKRLEDAHRRAAFLVALGEAMESSASELVELCERETGLATDRLRGELDRTVWQAELFATVIEDGSYVEAIIDTADPAWRPAPRPDLRRMLVSVGPVAVFGASNFPFAFGLLGGDTVSAIAAGCPVIAKGHPAHAGTSAILAEIVGGALRSAGLPPGTFSALEGPGEGVGREMVEAPQIAAVGFTGSLRGGRRLGEIAAARAVPIPVCAEMGASNPFFVGPLAAESRGEQIGKALAGAVLLGAGQFCTKPGLAFIPEGDAGDALVREIGVEIDSADPAVLLHGGIGEGLRAATQELERHRYVTALSEPVPPETQGGEPRRFAPRGWSVPADILLTSPELLEERFGPVILIARYESPAELAEVFASLPGQLTGTVHVDPAEVEELRPLIDLLGRRVGRLVFDGVPTGVAVTYAMHHGGPSPATSDAAYTSVGPSAIRRFLRPLAYQDTPPALLPKELRDDNPLAIWRTVDGRLRQGALDAL